MIGLVRSLGLALVLGLLLIPAARAGDVEIHRAAVGNSIGPGGEPQLDIYLTGTSSLSESGRIIGYFSDGQTGAALDAPSGSPYSTGSGQVAVASDNFSGSGLETLFQEKMSIPHFALNVEPYKKRRIQVSLFLDKGNSPADNLEFVDELGFDFIIDNPFKHGKKHRRSDVSDILRNRFRDLLPDRPAIRMDAFGRWKAYTAFDSSLPDLVRRQVSTTILVEDGRTISLGGNVSWRRDGSADSWQGLHDYIEPTNTIVLPKLRFNVAPVDSETNRGQIQINSRIIEIDGNPVVPGTQPPPRRESAGTWFFVPARVIQVEDRKIQFDFESDRVEAYNQVPALSDIPTLKNLFRNGRPVRDRRTLLLFITPSILHQTEQR